MSSERPTALPRFPQPYTNRLAWRAIVLWFAVRLVVLALVVLSTLAGSDGQLRVLLEVPLITGSPRIAVATTATVVSLAAIDLHATRENILIANLGLSRTRALLLVGSIAFALEVVILIGTLR